jgi:hypothetical protein
MTTELEPTVKKFLKQVLSRLEDLHRADFWGLDEEHELVEVILLLKRTIDFGIGQ